MPDKSPSTSVVTGRRWGPVIWRFRLPDGREIVSLRRDVFDRALAAAGRALREVYNGK